MSHNVTIQELQLAAKAAGYKTVSDSQSVWILDAYGDPDTRFCPHLRNGQALELAAAIKQNITFRNGDVRVLNACISGTDTLEQLRMAIFGAAVQIGRGMP